MRFHLFVSMGSRFSGLGSFWVSFGVSWEPLLMPGGTHLDFSWATWRLLGRLGWLLGSLREPCGSNLGFSWVTLCKSGHQLGDFVSLRVRFGFFWVSGVWIKSFVLSWEATGWVCGCWWSRFRSRLSYIVNSWIFCWNIVSSFTSNIFVALLVYIMVCVYTHICIYIHYIHVRGAFVGNELLYVCKSSIVIDVV